MSYGTLGSIKQYIPKLNGVSYTHFVVLPINTFAILIQGKDDSSLTQEITSRFYIFPECDNTKKCTNMLSTYNTGLIFQHLTK